MVFLDTKISKRRMDFTIRKLCARDVPGDNRRNLEVDSYYQGHIFKHFVVPIWLVS